MSRYLYMLSVGLSAFACSACDAALECAPENMIGGVCAGLPQNPYCSADICTEGEECAAVVEIADSAQLSSAIDGASAGTCFALKPGNYGAITLPPGLKLLGKSADEVSIASLTFASGKGAVVRGLTIAPGGTLAIAQTEARLEAVRVSGGQEAAIRVESGSILSVSQSEVKASARHGILVNPGGSVMLHASIVTENAGPGLTAGCEGATCCADPMPSNASIVQVDHTILRHNRVLGMALAGTKATMENIRIEGTDVGDDWLYGEGGGGIQLTSCTSLVARGLEVRNNVWFGILVDTSSVDLGIEQEPEGIRVSGNRIGVWLQNISKPFPQKASIVGALIDGNQGVGLGIDHGSNGIIFCKSRVTDTTMTPMLTVANVEKDIGDGVVWAGTSGAEMDSVMILNSARVAMLIDGPVEGNSKLSMIIAVNESMASAAIIHQNLPPGAETPAAQDVAPEPKLLENNAYDLVLAPGVQAGL